MKDSFVKQNIGYVTLLWHYFYRQILNFLPSCLAQVPVVSIYHETLQTIYLFWVAKYVPGLLYLPLLCLLVDKWNHCERAVTVFLVIVLQSYREETSWRQTVDTEQLTMRLHRCGSIQTFGYDHFLSLLITSSASRETTLKLCSAGG